MVYIQGERFTYRAGVFNGRQALYIPGGRFTYHVGALDTNRPFTCRALYIPSERFTYRAAVFHAGRAFYLPDVHITYRVCSLDTGESFTCREGVIYAGRALFMRGWRMRAIHTSRGLYNPGERFTSWVCAINDAGVVFFYGWRALYILGGGFHSRLVIILPDARF